MTVNELIEVLKAYDPEAEVYMDAGFIDLIELTEVTQSDSSTIVVS